MSGEQYLWPPLPATSDFDWRDDDWEPRTLHAALDLAVEQWGPAAIGFTYVDDAVQLSFGQLVAEAEACARGLLAAGVEPGDRVAACLPGHPKWPVIQVAASMAGAVLVGINTRYRHHELVHLLEAARPTVLFTMDEWRGIPFPAMLRAVLDELDERPDAVLGPACVTLGPPEQGFASFAEFLRGGEDVPVKQLRELAMTVDPLDIAVIQFTSGSTSAPKGVLLTHDNVLSVAFHVTMAAQYVPGELVYSALPFYHIGGTMCTGAGAIVSGAHMVVPRTYDALESARDIVEIGCTAQQGHAAMFTMQIDAARAAGLLDAFRVTKGWAAAPPSTMARIHDEMRVDGIVPFYGLSEYGLVTGCVPEDPVEKRINTVGRPAPGTEVRLDPAGHPSGAGEIQVRGRAAMRGYFNDPEETRHVLGEDGWVRTGDVGRWDEDGYLVFVDREKDMIKPGGENVSAREVEEFLLTNPSIAAAAVIAVPDERLAQAPAAVVQASGAGLLTEREIIDWCRGRIANFKTPKAVFIVDELPLLPNGKIDKQNLRARFG